MAHQGQVSSPCPGVATLTTLFRLVCILQVYNSTFLVVSMAFLSFLFYSPVPSSIVASSEMKVAFVCSKLKRKQNVKISTYSLYSQSEGPQHTLAGSDKLDGGPGLCKGPQDHIQLGRDCDTHHSHMPAPVGSPGHSCSLLLGLIYLQHKLFGDELCLTFTEG